MCRTMTSPAAESQTARDVRRMKQAAAIPGVREFARMVADARRLAHRMNQWAEANPVCEMTSTNLALRTALKAEWHDDDCAPDAIRAISALGITIEATVDTVTSVMLPGVFPECFEQLTDSEPDNGLDEQEDEPTQPAKRSARKTVCNRIQPFAG